MYQVAGGLHANPGALFRFDRLRFGVEHGGQIDLIDVAEPVAHTAHRLDELAISPSCLAFLGRQAALAGEEQVAAIRRDPSVVVARGAVYLGAEILERLPEAILAIFLARRRLFTAASRTCGALNSRQIDAAVEQLLAQVVERAAARHRFMRDQQRGQLVEEAKTILAREYKTDLTATGLAHRLHCSLAYLSRTFHAATGFKLVDYRHELRLRKAAYLIEQADAEIGEIAVRVGFASHSHFTSAFHRRFGITPSEYLQLD